MSHVKCGSRGVMSSFNAHQELTGLKDIHTKNSWAVTQATNRIRCTLAPLAAAHYTESRVTLNATS